MTHNSRPEFRSDMVVTVVDHMGDDVTPVRAARVSTTGEQSLDTEESNGLLRFLMREYHHVPFEHQAVTFYIKAPIFVTRQLLKHRLTSISETSGRYRELDGVFHLPALDRPVQQIGKTGNYQFVQNTDLHEVARSSIRYVSSVAWDEYNHQLDRGVAKEVARAVLPTNLYSDMYLTVNSRSLFNIFTLRSSHGHGHPQHEIKQVADQMFDLWAGLFPQTAAAWRHYFAQVKQQ